MLQTLDEKMREADRNLDFETAALLRDQIFEIKEMRAQKTSSAAKTIASKNKKGK